MDVKDEDEISEEQNVLPPDIGTDGKQSHVDRLIALIQKEPKQRTDFECHQFMPFLMKSTEWFSALKPEMVKEIIKRCKFLRIPPETILIKQGDLGDSMYAILRGVIGVHVIFDSENDKESLPKVEPGLSKKKFNKSDLGNEVTQKKEGACIGEVALVNENSTRTASCVSTTVCDLLVIDRALYNVSVREVIEKEFQDKRDFVQRNSLFKDWTPRQKSQLMFSLKKLKIGFSQPLVKQGHDLDGIYFIYRGEVEIHIDTKQYEKQYPQLYTEMRTLLPELAKKPQASTQAPHLLLKERSVGQRSQKLCLLGTNETIGSLEVILGLNSYIETVVSPGDCELLVFRRAQFEKAFKRKMAVDTLQKLKEDLANKLCLYIYQSDPKNLAFLKFLNMKLMDPEILQEVKKRKQGKSRQGAVGAEKTTKSVGQQEIVNMMKKLHMRTESATELPPEDMSEIALAKMDMRLRLWNESTQMHSSKLASLQSAAILLTNHT